MNYKRHYILTYVGLYSTVLFLDGVVWITYNQAFLLRKHGKLDRQKHWEKGRCVMTSVMWLLGIVTTVLSSVDCYAPEWHYNLLHSHGSLMVDILATSESIIATFILYLCDNETSKIEGYVLGGVGIGASVFSLLSSVAGLGESIGRITVISHWGYGCAGFVLATIVRTVPVTIAKTVYTKVKQLAASP
jgi:hypothetical protein